MLNAFALIASVGRVRLCGVVILASPHHQTRAILYTCVKERERERESERETNGLHRRRNERIISESNIFTTEMEEFMNRRNALNENVRTGQSDKCVERERERERERDERVCGREREGGRVATPTLESQTGFSYTMKYISVQS